VASNPTANLNFVNVGRVARIGQLDGRPAGLENRHTSVRGRERRLLGQAERVMVEAKRGVVVVRCDDSRFQHLLTAAAIVQTPDPSAPLRTGGRQPALERAQSIRAPPTTGGSWSWTRLTSTTGSELAEEAPTRGLPRYGHRLSRLVWS
jgi:hypothetical protein